jgi:hypothetical protein
MLRGYISILLLDLTRLGTRKTVFFSIGMDKRILSLLLLCLLSCHKKNLKYSLGSQIIGVECVLLH